MRKRLLYWELAGFVVVGALGALSHFVYQWSGRSVFVACFAAVNESTWEHMKLLFFPMFLFSVVQLCAMGKNYPNFLAVRSASILFGCLLIPVLFYTYAGVLGTTVDWVNILIFYLAALGAFSLDYCLLRRGRMNAMWQQLLGLVILWVLAFAFVWFTFNAPQLGLWQDPITGTYGVKL